MFESLQARKRKREGLSKRRWTIGIRHVSRCTRLANPVLFLTTSPLLRKRHQAGIELRATQTVVLATVVEKGHLLLNVLCLSWSNVSLCWEVAEQDANARHVQVSVLNGSRCLKPAVEINSPPIAQPIRRQIQSNVLDLFDGSKEVHTGISYA